VLLLVKRQGTARQSTRQKNDTPFGKPALTITNITFISTTAVSPEELTEIM
jgi:hypothetical protein